MYVKKKMRRTQNKFALLEWELLTARVNGKRNRSIEMRNQNASQLAVMPRERSLARAGHARLAAPLPDPRGRKEGTPGLCPRSMGERNFWEFDFCPRPSTQLKTNRESKRVL
jgi:hypothetical protein